eukprot:181554_1
MASIGDLCIVFWMGIMVIINIMIFISLMTSCYKTTTSAQHIQKQKQTKKQTFLYISTHISMLLFMFTSTLYFIGGMFVVITSNRVLAKKYANIGNPTDMLSTPFMLFAFIIRLDITFINTKYESNNVFMKILYITSIFLIILAFILSVTYVAGINASMGQWSLILGFLWMLLEWVLSILLIIMFLRKLNVLLIDTANAYTKMAKTIEWPVKPTNNAIVNDANEVNNVNEVNEVTVKDSESNTFYSMSSTTKELKNEDNKSKTYESVITSEHIQSVIDQKLLDNMIKNSILVPVAIISSFIILVISTILINVYSDTDIVMYPGMYILWVFDSTLNTFCLFCFLSFNHNKYYKFCGPLHRCCAMRKLKKMQNSNQILQVINQRLENQENQLQMTKTDDSDVDVQNINDTITNEVTAM